MRRTLLSVSLVALVVLLWPATASRGHRPSASGPPAISRSWPGTPNIANTGPTWISGQIGHGAGLLNHRLPARGIGRASTNATRWPSTAKTDLTAAYNDAANATVPWDQQLPGVNLGGKNPGPRRLLPDDRTDADRHSHPQRRRRLHLPDRKHAGHRVRRKSRPDRRRPAVRHFLGGGQLGDDRHLDGFCGNHHGFDHDHDEYRRHARTAERWPATAL